MLLPNVLGRYPRQNVIHVIEDNSRVHRANIVKRWYKNQPRIVRLPHSPKSPDLRYMENIWAKMVRDSRSNYAANIENFYEKVVDSWFKPIFFENH